MGWNTSINLLHQLAVPQSSTTRKKTYIILFADMSVFSSHFHNAIVLSLSEDNADLIYNIHKTPRHYGHSCIFLEK